ncbi:MAG TPA: hypothetical protein VM142_02500 [Acidimicrobiales bacterium]|nr:hypothetical protein [Acidimicrobiales bacterium]
MSITYRRLGATILVAAVMSGACSDGGDDKKAAPAGGAAGKQAPVQVKVGGVHSPAAGLRAQLTSLLQEHVFLSGIATDLVLAGKDPAPVGVVLEANTAALGTTFSQVYDDVVAQRLVELWRQKSALVTQFAQATAVGDQAATAKVKADLELYKGEFATFLNETNPQLAADLLEDDAGTHVNSLLGVVTAQFKKDPLALSKLKDAAKVMPRTGAVFAAGIVKQMPESYKGTADGSGATLLATLTATFQEHVYLLGATTRTVVAGGDDKKPREILDESSEGLANLVSSLYGDPAGRRFLQVWRGHIGAFVDYAEAAAARDAAAAQKATTDLATFRTRLGALLEGLNKNLPSQAVAVDFEDYVAAMEAAIAAQAVADPAEFQLLHDAASTTPLLAEVLAGAIAKQFDSKFS